MRLLLRHCPCCVTSTEQVAVDSDDLWRCRRCESEICNYKIVKLGPDVAHKLALQASAQKSETASVL